MNKSDFIHFFYLVMLVDCGVGIFGELAKNGVKLRKRRGKRYTHGIVVRKRRKNF